MRKPFSWQQRGRSFGYALQGLKALFQTEHNAWIHAALTAVALLLAVWLRITKTEALLLVLVTAFVWVAEIFNTALEKTADLITLEKYTQIGHVKDLSAAAVLLSAVAAFLVGAIIFLPKMFSCV